jgi:hypothetical protein
VGGRIGNEVLNQIVELYKALLQYLRGAVTVIPAVHSGKSTHEFHNIVRCRLFRSVVGN